MLPQTIPCFQFSPPLTQQTLIEKLQILSSQTTLLPWFTNQIPLDQIIFLFLTISFPKELSNYFGQTFHISQRKQIH
jgi:hypothetical protein